MISLLVHLKDYKKESVLAPLFKMLEASFELFVPLVMAAIIDVGIANQDKPHIAQMCFVLIALGIIGLVCSITAQYFAAKAATGVGTGIRHGLFEHIQKFTFTEMDQLGTSTLITRMTSDINQIQSGVNLVLRLFLRSPFIVFGAMIMAFTVDVKAALVFVVTIPLLSLIVFGIMLVTMPMYKKVQADLDQVLLATRENLTGARVIRAFNKEEDETKRFENANQILTDAQKYVGRISGMMNPLTYIIVNGAIIALIYVGAVRVDIGDLTQGQVVALINYMSQILVELVKLANLIISVTKAAACLNRVESVLAVKPDMNEGDVRWKSNSSETDWDLKNKIPVVEFSHVSLTYKGASDTSLSDINFCAKKGQTIGIIGGTGSGKSSLVNLIPRFYDATDGTVKINGRDIKEYQTENLREHIGVVLQKAVLFKGSIADNLRWGKEDATEQEMYEALDISQAREFVDTKQGGLEFQIEQGGRNLSGGQKQRLSIARAIAKHPQVFIFDDSFSALDYKPDVTLRHALAEKTRESTVLIVAQRISTILHAEQILVLDDGKIVGKGTHAELLKNCEVYREIAESQLSRAELESAVQTDGKEEKIHG